jgi:hydrogenase maturation factor HypF (carbamoyltransferase family)
MLAKLKIQNSKLTTYKDIYKFIEKYYSRNEFELLYSQLQQGFNCVETSSAGRVLDAVAVLLGFAGNQRKYKHEAAALLAENSTEPYLDIEPRLLRVENNLISNAQYTTHNDLIYVLDTTCLFEYLVKNLEKDKGRLAATAQKYIADGLVEIIQKKLRVTSCEHHDVFVAGGIVNNKIISDIFEGKGFYLSKKIPRGDAGLSFGQVIYYLMNSKN